MAWDSQGPASPTHYQLLGIVPNEQDVEVIEAAAVRQVAFVRNFQTGPHAEQCSRILTELAEARLTLLNPAKRRKYDGCLATARDTERVRQRRIPQTIPSDELAKLSSLLTDANRADQPSRATRRGKGSQHKGWSSLTLAVRAASPASPWSPPITCSSGGQKHRRPSSHDLTAGVRHVPP